MEQELTLHTDMATFVSLDSNNIVQELIAVSDEYATTESDGIAVLKSVRGDGNYVQSFDDGTRRRPAKLNDYYDSATDGFYSQINTDNSADPQYINIPNGTSYCLIYRNGSSLITGLIKKTYFNQKVTGQSAQNILGLQMTATPVGSSHAIIRDPVDRFISSYALRTGGVPCWLGVDEFIGWLGQQDQTTINKHFRKQTLLVGDPAPEGITYHDFATLDFDALATTFGLPTPVEKVNETDVSKKPTLTDDQIATLRNIYADDVELYARLTAQ